MRNWKYINGAEVVNGALDWKIVTPTSKSAKYKMGQTVKVDGEQGTITQIQPMKLSDTPTYKIRMKSGKEIWRYEEEIGNIKVINSDREFFKELADDAKEREDKDKQEVEKLVGNALPSLVSEYNAEIQRLTRKAEQLRRMGQGKSAMEVEKQIEKLGKELAEVSNSKVGNETYQHKLYPDKYVIIEGKNYKIVTDGKVEKSGELTDAVLYGINQTYKRVGNFKTGKSALKPGDRVQSYGVQGTVRKVEGENSDNIYGEPIIEVEWDNGTVKKVGEHYLRKIGNKVGNSKWELPDGSTATVEDDGTIKIKKPRDSSIYTTKLWDKERAEKQLAQKGAKKVGNSASDDKFAYVMREFDEGKLKTPDGKVVTDPEQAKAIAYSESKKTENGLARARNAMAKNKKVKNSAVREYKHSDGRVAQIDFNEDGSDADMSIYEGTREIEQRNFSTIRDAEQYVTSHGFRRI